MVAEADTSKKANHSAQIISAEENKKTGSQMSSHVTKNFSSFYRLFYIFADQDIDKTSDTRDTLTIEGIMRNRTLFMRCILMLSVLTILVSPFYLPQLVSDIAQRISPLWAKIVATIFVISSLAFFVYSLERYKKYVRTVRYKNRPSASS